MRRKSKSSGSGCAGIALVCLMMFSCSLLSRSRTPPAPSVSHFAEVSQPSLSLIAPAPRATTQRPDTALPSNTLSRPPEAEAAADVIQPLIAEAASGVSQTEGRREEASGVRPIPERSSDAEETPDKPCTPVVIETLSGRVVSIADGDTLTILTDDKKRVIIRLEGIDAPERGQEHGTKAKEALSDLVFNRAVIIKATGTDRYHRTLGYVVLNGLDVDEQLVEDGWAWHFTKYNCEERFDKAEKRARAAKKGLWAHESPIAPWEFRAIKAETPVKIATPRSSPTKAAESLPEVMPAKPSVTEPEARDYWLNTAKGSNVRHNSGCRWFGKTKSGRYCTKSEGRPCGICGG